MFHPLGRRLSSRLRSGVSSLRADAPWFLVGGMAGAALGDRARELRPTPPGVEALPGLETPAVIPPPGGRSEEGA